MNKWELKGKINKLSCIHHHMGILVDRHEVLQLIYQLDEPKKVKLKSDERFIADWYEEHKDMLEYSIYLVNCDTYEKYDNCDFNTFERWIDEDANHPIETLIKMKLYGYEIEEEPKYYAKIKGWELVSFRPHYWIKGDHLTFKDNQRLVDKASKEFAKPMTKSEWNALGINDDNAVFEPVNN